MKNVKFYICKHCGNIITKIEDSTVPVVCCGEKMSELVPNTVEASVEKHLPVASVEGNVVNVSVGSVAHPMAEEHHIGWVYLETCCGGQIKSLPVGVEPTVSFAVNGEKPLAVYAYCNLHGLWKTEL